MAAGKRNNSEDFGQYRARLKREAAALKEYLRGKFVWVSCIITSHKKTGKLMKVRAMGTYVKKQTLRKGKVVR
jgi:hypothetical protein